MPKHETVLRVRVGTDIFFYTEKGLVRNMRDGQGYATSDVPDAMREARQAHPGCDVTRCEREVVVEC